MSDGPSSSGPIIIAIIARIDPLTYGVDALRGTLIGASHFGLPVDLAVLATITGVLLIIGSWLFSRIQI